MSNEVHRLANPRVVYNFINYLFTFSLRALRGSESIVESVAAHAFAAALFGYAAVDHERMLVVGLQISNVLIRELLPAGLSEVDFAHFPAEIPDLALLLVRRSEFASCGVGSRIAVRTRAELSVLGRPAATKVRVGVASRVVAT